MSENIQQVVRKKMISSAVIIINTN